MHEPTRKAADAFYLADWNETEALIRIGRREQISGIIGLCDKAMIPVAVVSETLGLPGNPSESMRKLLSKRSFRLLQEEAGVFCPRSSVSENPEEIERAAAGLCFPVIIKPMLASSSQGMTILQNAKGIREAFAEASAESRNGAVCIEEYIPNDSLRIIEADVFVVGNDILWDGDPVLDIRTAIQPIAKAVFVFDTEDELEAVRRHITQLVFPVIREN